MISIKPILSGHFISKYIAGITALSFLIVPFMPLTAFAVSDVIPPNISITSPINNTIVSGSISVVTNATDVAIPSTDCLVTVSGIQYDVTSLQNTHPGGNIFACGTDMTAIYLGQHGANVSRLAPYTIPQSGISKVELWIDGNLNQTDSSSPFAFTWNSATVSNGTHTIVAKAFDLSNNRTSSAVITVTTNNTVITPPSIDTIAPVVSIISPVNSTTTARKLIVTTSATDNVGVTKVELYVDGTIKTSTTTAPYTFIINKSMIKKGVHTLTLKAYDAAGNVGTSSDVRITVTGKTIKIHHENERKEKHEDKKEKKDKKIHDDDRENGLLGRIHLNLKVEKDD